MFVFPSKLSLVIIGIIGIFFTLNRRIVIFPIFIHARYFYGYFENIEGGLSEYLNVKILDQEKILDSGKMFDLTRDKVSAYDEPLESGEKKILTLLPEDVGNEAMNQFLIFDFGIEAVQTRNNPDKEF